MKLHHIKLTADDGEIVAALTREAGRRDIKGAVIITVLGALERFQFSTMPQTDDTQDTVHSYTVPAEICGHEGVIKDGKVHLHLSLGITGDNGKPQTVGGHFLNGEVGSHFVLFVLMAA